MARLSLLISLFLLSLTPADISSREVCAVPLARVVRIPVTMQGSPDLADSSKDTPDTLLVSAGAADELPEGPASFDVLEDGSFVIADPLRGRICIFDAQGKFSKAFKTGFVAGSVSLFANGMLAIEESATGKFYVFDEEGHARPKEVVRRPEGGEARVLSARTGTFMRTANDRSPLQISIEKPTLLSLEGLGRDESGNSFVALEATPGGAVTDEVRVNKYIRKYAADGTLLSEISGIPLNYYVVPIDELRLRNGKVYQLLTTRGEVRINIWNTNQVCSPS